MRHTSPNHDPIQEQFAISVKLYTRLFKQDSFYYVENYYVENKLEFF